MTRRAASICLAVIQHASIDCNPNSPKTTVLPDCALPFRVPRWDLRYFTLFGCSTFSPCFGDYITLIYPYLYTDMAHNSIGFNTTITYISTDGVQRQPSLARRFTAGNFIASQPTSAAYFDAFSTSLHRFKRSLLHSTPESYSALKLISNIPP